MTISVDLYKNHHKLASATATAGSVTLTSVSANLSRTIGTNRNVQIVPTTGNCIGQTHKTRIVTDGGATVTMGDPCPFS